MKTIVFAAVIILATAACSGASATGPPQYEDRTGAPYFFVQSDDPESDRLPLISTSAKVNIAGVIADVIVTQIYENQGLRPIEAVYVFPASTRAAVYGTKMTVGERTIVAKIRRRADARQEYEQAKQAGKSAALLEQHRPNVFQMNVANILPGDRITVELRYTELLVPTDRIYEFVYPAVVGPRYAGVADADAGPPERWVANPYFREGQAPAYAFDIEVGIHAGLPVRQIACRTHPVTIQYQGKTDARVNLDSAAADGGNRDFVLHYRLAGDRIESGLLLHAGEKENFFMLMLQPPERVRLEQLPGREYIFIVDVSGSMRGFPLEITQTLLADLIGDLRPTDRFNVLLFAGGSRLLSERSLPATPANVAKAQRLIADQRGGGGTELLPALQRALALPRTAGVSRSVVIATDGYVTVEAEAFELVRNRLGEANLFAFGIGSSVNRHLIEGLARVGMGEPFVITKTDEAPAKAKAFRRMVRSPVLTAIEMEIEGLDAYDVEPRSIGDVFAERPVVVFGKWRGRPQGTITISGITGDRRYQKTIFVSDATPGECNAALRYLWARHRIRQLADDNRLGADDERIEAVTRLGLTYNLLTDYTSFVAVDSKVRNSDGEPTLVIQPLPLPEGVSDYALGDAAVRTLAAPQPQVGGGVTLRVTEKTCEETAETKTASEPRLRIERVVVRGSLSEAEVQNALQAQILSLQPCLAEAQRRGDLKVRLDLAADGRVIKITVVSETIGSPGWIHCVNSRIQSLRFPSSGDGGPTMVTLVLRSP